MTDLPIVKTCVGLRATGECLIHRGGEMMCSHVCDESPSALEHKCDDPPPPVEPCPSAHRFGLYRRGELAGVALFGPPASMNAHRAVFPTLAIGEAVTLGRLVLLDEVPGNGESWFITRCFELLRGRGIVAIESCSDPQPRTTIHGTQIHRGHLGIVYQATNGRYVGKTNEASLRLLPDGTCLSNRASGKFIRGERGGEIIVETLVRWGAEPLKYGDDALRWLRHWRSQLTRPMRHYGNHRYLWCLDDRRRRELEPYGPRRQYPKNENERR